MGQAIVETINIVSAADVLARRYRWILSTSWPPELVLKIGMLAEKGRRDLVIDSYILSYYRDNDWLELERLVDAICEFESVRQQRAQVLRDLVALMRAGERGGFNAATFAIPRLFAELEGLARDYARSDLGLIDTSTRQ